MGASHRVERRRLTERLGARATTTSAGSSSSSKTFPTPTVKIALTSAFSGPSTCDQNLLTMLPPPTYQIWANEPVPVENNTVAACYPTEFLQSYTSVMITVESSPVPSSIVPAMSPFACPKNYCTALASARNYIVCCPSNYQFHPPASTVDSSRPFYGGTCYSDMTMSSSYPVLQYNTNGDTASTLFPVTATNVQAFAHPIDGFALTSPTALGCSKSSSGLSTDSSSSNGNSQASDASSSATAAAAARTGMSGGAIAGAVVGGILGLAAIVGLVFFLLAYRRKNKNAPATPPDAHHMSDDYGQSKGDAIYRHEANTSFTHAELGSSQRGLVNEKSGTGFLRHEMNDGHGAVEMPADGPIEMYAGPFGKTHHDDKTGLATPSTSGKNRSSVANVLDKHEKERMARMGNWNNN
ncbi:hypothetical protein P280DRAFT_546225 [Massarina eburnea CBS 473.64]|uniref:Mid2 domain-containing protein n=1 Tax=Massarina eburnea CBS 473.64 TaxID=1395130 RepID=A0A6A6SF00_9PLEO|nr:hypothetical protein P280DRAFT_546225 [Massarina eburnea CBS 473.64]